MNLVWTDLEAIFQTTGLELTQMGNLDTTIAGKLG
jgi:hypothetical protein